MSKYEFIKLSSFLVLFLVLLTSFGQYRPKSLAEISRVLDTLEVQKQHLVLLNSWYEDSIETIVLQHPILYDTLYNQKFLRDSLYIPTADDVRKQKEFIQTASQNCYSYALQESYTYHGIDPKDVFNKDVFLTLDGFKQIIDTNFRLENSFKSRPKRNLKFQPKDGSLIVFYDQFNTPSYTFFFHDNVFYSKNGGFAVKQYDSMKDIYRTYYYTQRVHVYSLNLDLKSD
ncbi:hypothetical protein [Marinoscillum sp.]|uniref:hypothetical protein n=1 Tax=Marinoscillum sp. TaxID=2024838 RepID=UPI003BAC543A